MHIRKHFQYPKYDKLMWYSYLAVERDKVEYWEEIVIV